MIFGENNVVMNDNLSKMQPIPGKYKQANRNTLKYFPYKYPFTSTKISLSSLSNY